MLGKGFFLFAAAVTGAAAAWAVSGIAMYGAILSVSLAALVLLSRLPARYPIPTGTGVVITGASSGIGRDAAIEMVPQPPLPWPHLKINVQYSKLCRLGSSLF